MHTSEILWELYIIFGGTLCRCESHDDSNGHVLKRNRPFKNGWEEHPIDRFLDPGHPFLPLFGVLVFPPCLHRIGELTDAIMYWTFILPADDCQVEKILKAKLRSKAGYWRIAIFLVPIFRNQTYYMAESILCYSMACVYLRYATWGRGIQVFADETGKSPRDLVDGSWVLDVPFPQNSIGLSVADLDLMREVEVGRAHSSLLPSQRDEIFGGCARQALSFKKERKAGCLNRWEALPGTSSPPVASHFHGKQPCDLPGQRQAVIFASR